MVTITIDTKKDSADDIRKTIEYLKTFLSQTVQDTPDAPDGAFNMFSQDPKPEKKDDDEYDIKPMLY